ncbi:hypothetical protein NG798_03105 [Ancylothrix sp. C2]|uniref:hypothetical protein n=1 Tax=Ancylothrix sp. D3o TaxID=2953691 RepID=UPI0021BAE9AF|nr:hypothetical protein [Ancylothrix sp. D3o]MCT7948767.1 hypothetical protein [Ancylothrix sp. D3o]
MEIPQILQFVDDAVYQIKNKHLNDIQRRIITGILNRQKYQQIGETYGYSEKHIKKTSHELLQILSEVFGEKVRRSNLESVLERQINVHINLGNKNSRNKNTVNIASLNKCPDSSTATPHKTPPLTPNSPQHKPPQINLESINKFRQFGLSDEQIADALGIPLEALVQIDLSAG